MALPLLVEYSEAGLCSGYRVINAAHDARRDEDDEFGFDIAVGTAAEETTDDGNPT